MGKFLLIPNKENANVFKISDFSKTSGLWSLGVVPYLSVYTPSTHNENHMHSKSGEEILNQI